jgi:thiopeptide-type bacteriocin biosynthesis protein
VLRAPLLPLATLHEWSQERDVAEARRRLAELLDDALLAEALYLASPSLAAAVGTWRAAPESTAGQATERALVRYLARAATRCTPFGLFASVSVGRFSTADNAPAGTLQLAARTALRRRSRLDNDYLFAACAELARDPNLQRELRYAPNSSLYRVADRFRYAEARVVGATRTYHLVAIEPTPYLEAVLARAEAGATLAELRAVLCQDPDISADEADAYLLQLIETQVLESDLQPPVTGADPLRHLAAALRATNAGATAGTAFEHAAAVLTSLDRAPAQGSPSRYDELAATLRTGVPFPVDPARLVQVDALRPVEEARLGPAIMARITTAIDVLRRIAGRGDDASWASFRAAFVRRYETRTVPLVEVLDEEVGIGFGATGSADAAPLIAGLAFPPVAAAPTPPFGRVAALLAGRVGMCLRRGDAELVLDDAALGELAAPDAARLPPSFAVNCTLLASAADALATGEVDVFLRFVDGAPGTRLLGRFADLDHDLAALVASNIQAEEALQPSATFAEIVHLPEGRIGNVLMRPVLRPVEIVFMGSGNASAATQLPVTDLLISIVDGRVVVSSRRLGCEVAPRLASAHGVGAHSLRAYAFLTALANQGVDTAHWDWGGLAALPALPRVRYRHVILARAQWRLDRNEVQAITSAHSDGPGGRRATMQAVARIRAGRALPRWIVLADGDNELPVDLDNELSVASFVHLLRGKASATLLEFLPDPSRLCVDGPDGAYAHELVIPFVRTAPEPPALTAPGHPTSLVRRYPPGSEWLYAKIFCGTATTDGILRDAVRPTVEAGRAAALIDRWFFVRYRDGGPHVRLRFRGVARQLLSDVWPGLLARLSETLANGGAWQVQLDTYEREVERYGGPAGIELCEQLFAADSDAVVASLVGREGDAGADLAWRLALRGLDGWFDDFGLDPARRLAFVTRLRDQFAAEHHATTEFHRQLGRLFRERAEVIEATLAPPSASTPLDLVPGIATLAERSRAVAPVVTALRERAARGELTSTLDALLSDVAHMHVNRMLSSAQRQQEFVLYDLLRRHYARVRGRSRPAA